MAIETRKHSIGTAFRECFYVVPDYQREYVWTDKEVHQLLEDINEQIDLNAEREYFIGTILVSPTSQENHYEVIDGQQRLTTLFLLLCALKHLFQNGQQQQMIAGLISTSYADDEGEIHTHLKLEPRYENAGEVMTTLVNLDGDPQTARAGIQAAGIANFGSLENLINAYSTLYRYLQENYDNITQLRRYWGYLANNVVFIQISTNISSALKIFETINERGVGLNPMDLLKNLLFKQVEPTEFTQLKNEWKEITKPLEKANEKPLRFLRYFLMANYVIHNQRGDSVVREDEIYDWFVARDNAALCNYTNRPIEFVRKVIRNVEHYLAFAKGLGNDGTPSLAMDSLRRLTGGAFSLHYVLLLAAANLSKPLFEHFVVQLESFLFYYVFTKTPTKDLERSFSQWADELRMITEVEDTVEQKIQLNAFVANRFANSMAGKSKELADALKRLTLHSMQKYRIRYLLARLTQHVDMAFRGQRARGNLDPFYNLQIEHILPNNPTAGLLGHWTNENPGVDYNDYKNRLGNLTLLEQPINVVASNDFYASKQELYQQSGHYLTRSLVNLANVGQNNAITRINTQLQAFSTWNAASIETRHEMLIALTQDVWKTTPIDV